MTNAQSSFKNPKSREGLRTTGRDGSAAVPEPLRPEKQLANFEAASRLFHARKFGDARALFLRAAEGPERDVAHRARLHAAMCDQRLEQPAVHCQTAEDYYNYGVALLNTRKIHEASSNLERALQLAPHADHIHYAMAVAQGLLGDPGRAHEHLSRAIDLEPKNRLMARQDPDLGSIIGQPQFQALLYPEKKNW